MAYNNLDIWPKKPKIAFLLGKSTKNLNHPHTYLGRSGEDINLIKLDSIWPQVTQFLTPPGIKKKTYNLILTKHHMRTLTICWICAWLVQFPTSWSRTTWTCATSLAHMCRTFFLLQRFETERCRLHKHTHSLMWP